MNRYDRYISMVQGDTLQFNLEFDGLDKDLDSAYFTCKQNFTDRENLFQKSLGNGITKVDDGVYVVRVAPADTKNASAGKYFYDLQFGLNGDIYTVMRGVLELEPEVTVAN